MKLENKVAIITGGAMGIGNGIVKVFLKYGAQVIILDYDDKLPAVINELRETYPKITGAKVDLRNKKAIQEIVNEIISRFGRIDILVNNAGVAVYKDFLELTEEERDFQIDVNIKGTWDLTREVIPHMLRTGKGSIVNVSSVTGPLVADAGASAYALTKSAVLGLTKALAIEYADKGIRINAIQPGVVRTPLLEANSGGNVEEAMRLMGEGVPMKRLGDPLEAGELVAFLASDEASYITGQGVVFDGGSTLPETNNVLGGE